jgi:hypothetical protein
MYHFRLQGRKSAEQLTSVQQMARQAGFLLSKLSNPKLQLLQSSETSVHIRTARFYTPEDGTIHN